MMTVASEFISRFQLVAQLEFEPSIGEVQHLLKLVAVYAFPPIFLPACPFMQTYMLVGGAIDAQHAHLK